jgi:Cu/Ag efflux protein CusF
LKKGLFIWIVLLTFAVMASGAIAQEKKTEAAAPTAEKAAPAKAKTPKATKVSGTVAVYEAGKMITVKGKKEKEMAFDITPKTKMKGEIKEGAKVTVMYNKSGAKMVATSITAAKPQKAKTPKKAE